MLYKRYREILSRKLRCVIYYTLYTMDPQNTNKSKYVCTTISKIRHLHTRPGFHLGAPTNHKSIWSKISRELLFQKVALDYLLHVVQNGSSQNILKHICLHNNLKSPNVTRLGFHLGAPEKRKVITKLFFYIKYIVKSSSRKLRRVIHYTLYRMDPHKTY